MSSIGAHLSPTAEEIFNLRHIARGTHAPTQIIRHGTILSLHTGELLERDVVISGRHIAAVTPWDYFAPNKRVQDGTSPHEGGEGAEIVEIEARGQFISPGFIDTHIHIEYTKLTPGELARLSVPRGTTTVLADANCIANVLGGRGMDFMGTTTTPLRIFRQVSHKVPMSGPDIELGGTSVSTEEICERVSRREAATLGESNPFSLDVASAEKQAAALRAGKRITGHTALLKNEPLWAYCAGGIGDDHNAHEPEDVLERLRLGLMITVMSGSMNSNLESIFRSEEDVKSYGNSLDLFSFCADDKLCEDLDATGHIDLHVSRAISLGISPTQAYKMATLNAAKHYRLDHLLGSITPGKLADLLILDSLQEAKPRVVIVDGIIVARDNKALFTNEDVIPPFALNTVNIHAVHATPESFRVRPAPASNEDPTDTPGCWVQAIEMYDGYFKRAFHAALPVSRDSTAAEFVLCDTARDILKVAIIDRHHGTSHRGLAYVRGFGLKRGAIGTTTNCENQNLVVVGVDDESMAAAVREIVRLEGGGMVAVDGADPSGRHRLLGEVRLQVAGCMSSAPWEEVRDASVDLERRVRTELGLTMAMNPFLIASFVGLVAVPDLGLTELGLVANGGNELMDPVLPLSGGKQALDNNGALEVTRRVCCRCPSHNQPVHKIMDPEACAD